MVRIRLIPLALALMTTAASVTAMGVAVPLLSSRAAAQTAIDDRPAADLSDEELMARFRAIQSVVRDKSADKALRKRLRGQMREDRAELRRRDIDTGTDDAPEEAADQEQPAPKSAEPQATPESAEQPVKQRAAPEPEAQPRRQQAAPEPEAQPRRQQAAPAPEAQPRRQQAAPAPDVEPRRQRAEPTPEVQPRQQQVAPEPEAQPRQQQAAPSTADQPRRRDNQQVQDQQQKAGDDDRRAQQILSDRRDAKQLKDDPLRQRLEVIREILGGGRVSARYERALLELLEGDREEMRGRVRRHDDGRERADRGRYGDSGGDRADRRDLRELLRDDRPSRRLTDAELTARSDAARDALGDKRLRRDQVATLRSMLESDRKELRSRLRAEREDRRRDLRRKGQAGGLKIEIRPSTRPAPRRSIAAAEVDTREIERQLVAPPTRPIQRRYSFEEYARRPELRDVMPGIELDTIHFGFNEYFVREEEIDELERIGEIIERILASSPGEVFVVEGHTDAVGSDAYNYDLSRKRAQAVKDALLEYFVIEPDNIETIGYGERYLKIPTEEDEVENRRVTVRRITPILMGRR